MALRNLRGVWGYKVDVTGQTLSWELGRTLASGVQGLIPDSGAGVLKHDLSDREEDGGWLPKGNPMAPLSDSFGVGGKRKVD